MEDGGLVEAHQLLAVWIELLAEAGLFLPAVRRRVTALQLREKLRQRLWALLALALRLASASRIAGSFASASWYTLSRSAPDAVVVRAVAPMEMKKSAMLFAGFMNFPFGGEIL